MSICNDPVKVHVWYVCVFCGMTHMYTERVTVVLKHHANYHQWIFLPRHRFQRVYVHGCLDHTADVKQRELLQNTNQAKQDLFCRFCCGPASTDDRLLRNRCALQPMLLRKTHWILVGKFMHALTEFTVHISSWRFICDCWCMDLLGLCPKALTLEESAGFCACICGCISVSSHRTPRFTHVLFWKWSEWFLIEARSKLCSPGCRDRDPDLPRVLKCAQLLGMLWPVLQLFLPPLTPHDKVSKNWRVHVYNPCLMPVPKSNFLDGQRSTLKTPTHLVPWSACRSVLFGWLCKCSHQDLPPPVLRITTSQPHPEFFPSLKTNIGKPLANNGIAFAGLFPSSPYESIPLVQSSFVAACRIQPKLLRALEKGTVTKPCAFPFFSHLLTQCFKCCVLLISLRLFWSERSASTIPLNTAKTPQDKVPWRPFLDTYSTRNGIRTLLHSFDIFWPCGILFNVISHGTTPFVFCAIHKPSLPHQALEGMNLSIEGRSADLFLLSKVVNLWYLRRFITLWPLSHQARLYSIFCQDPSKVCLHGAMFIHGHAHFPKVCMGKEKHQCE